MDENSIEKERFEKEKRIANKCEELLTTAMRGKISALGLHLSGKDNSMKYAVAKSNFTTNAERKWEDPKSFSMLKIVMPRHGFIQHYGVDRIRKGTDKKGFYREASHFTMQKRPFIVDAIKSSGVIEYAVSEVGTARANYLLKNLKYWIDKFDK